MAAYKVMTWNVENLFRPQADAADPEKQKYQEKLALLGSVISRRDPDALALKEVGGQEPLFDLRQALGGSYPHQAVSAVLLASDAPLDGRHPERGIPPS